MSRTKLAKARATLITTVLLCLAHSLFAPAANSAPREVTITLSADDNISGVAFMQIAEDKNNPPAPVVFSRTAVVTTEASILWVRVQDRALNWSAWVGVQVGGAPVIQDPLAKTVYVPVALVPYVPPAPTVETPTTLTPPSAPSAGASFGGSSGGVSVAAVEKIVETATVILSPVSETLTSAAPLPVVETSVVTTPVIDKNALVPNVASTPPGIKAVAPNAKVSVTTKLSSTGPRQVALGVNKAIALTMPSVIGTGSIKASITDSSGKKLTLTPTWDKKSGKITMPKLAFSKKGSYTVTTVVGKKTFKVTIKVS